jgi:metal-responsive CopG/Arc/MetJ family transcriptional regulator
MDKNDQNKNRTITIFLPDIYLATLENLSNLDSDKIPTRSSGIRTAIAEFLEKEFNFNEKMNSLKS